MAALPMPEESPPGTVDDAVKTYRPEFARYAARIAVEDPDDGAPARRWLAHLPGADAAPLADRPASWLAAAAREALRHHDGHLRDAALAFRPWDFRVEDVACPTRLWYGALDERALPGGRWLPTGFPARGSTYALRPRTWRGSWRTGRRSWRP